MKGTGRRAGRRAGGLTCAHKVVVRRELQTLRLLLEGLKVGRLQQAGARFEKSRRQRLVGVGEREDSIQDRKVCELMAE